MMNIDFRPLYWFYAILGGILGILTAAIVVLIWKMMQDHWR